MKLGEETATIAFNADGSVTIHPSPGPGAPAMGNQRCEGAMTKTCALVMFGMVAPPVAK